MLTVVHAHSTHKHDSFADAQVMVNEAIQELNQVQRLGNDDRLFEAVKSVAGVCMDVLEDDRRLVQDLDRFAKIQLDVPSHSSRNALVGALDRLKLKIKEVSILLL